MVFGRADGDGMADRVILRHVVGSDMAGVQEAEMRGVDIAFERLHEIA